MQEALDQVAVVFTANRQDYSFKNSKKLYYKLYLLIKEYRIADPPE